MYYVIRYVVAIHYTFFLYAGSRAPIDNFFLFRFLFKPLLASFIMSCKIGRHPVVIYVTDLLKYEAEIVGYVGEGEGKKSCRRQG